MQPRNQSLIWHGMFLFLINLSLGYFSGDPPICRVDRVMAPLETLSLLYCPIAFILVALRSFWVLRPSRVVVDSQSLGQTKSEFNLKLLM
jgi:hypothetical protein